MKKIVVRIICLLLISSAAYGATPGEVQVGEVLRDTPLYGLTGDFRMLADLRGKPLVINVWASWCGPCRREMGSLERLSRLYGGKQFNIIGVSTDDDANAAFDYVMRTGITFDNYLDNKLTLENMLGANTIPLTILIDAKGRVLKKVRGAREWDSQELIQMIATTLGVQL